MSTMRVSVTVSIELDPEDWALNYGIGDRAAIRADVKEYVQNVLWEQLRVSGIESAKVAVR